MTIIDKGHQYQLHVLDGRADQPPQILTFVKRCDPTNPARFPGNTNAYPGTTLQSVLRALLERFRYLQGQIWCKENVVAILCLRVVVWLLEFRAAHRHKRSYWHGLDFAEKAPICPVCGHTDCGGHL